MVFLMAKGLIPLPMAPSMYGAYKDGKKHGQGTLIFASGTKCVGEFKDDKSHGQGTVTWASGNKYVGQWKDGQPHGQGIWTWPGEGKYVGELKDGEPWEGTQYDNDGNVFAILSEGGKKSVNDRAKASKRIFNEVLLGEIDTDREDIRLLFHQLIDQIDEASPTVSRSGLIKELTNIYTRMSLYMKLFWEDALISLANGREFKSRKRFDLEKRYLQEEFFSKNRWDFMRRS